MNNSSSKKLVTSLLFAITILVLFIAFGYYKYYVLGKELESTKITFGDRVTNLETYISNLELERTSLTDALTAEQEKNIGLERRVEELDDSLDELNKLSRIDPELLKKYSKVFFLSEHYEPTRLATITNKYLFNEDDEEKINSKVWPFLRKLLDEAEEDGIDLKVLSGYRSFATQSTIKAQYKVTYGAGTANQFSAEQGYSEHQLGTTVDFTNETAGAGLNGFQNTPAFEWLTKNAHKYGFVLSYPPGNTYYQYEPWHWRFVGVDLASDLKEDEKYFYDLDQRDIDKYLINIFD